MAQQYDTRWSAAPTPVFAPSARIPSQTRAASPPKKATTRRYLRTLSRAIVGHSLVQLRLQPAKSRRIMLTFDDGPHPDITPQVLDLLDEHQAKAVFFVIGEHAAREPELVQEIYERGHVLGNHTYSHLNEHRGGTYTFGDYLQEVLRCSQILYDIVGVKTMLVRPPRGEINLKTLSAAWRSRHRMVYWSLQGGEWSARAGESGEAIAAFLSEHMRPRDIVLLHDNHEKTPRILERLLPNMRDRTFDFATAL